MTINLKKIIGIIIASLAILLLFLFLVPVSLKNSQNLHSIKLGLPIAYITQNSSYDYSIPSLYLFQSIREHPTKFSIRNFFFSFVLIFLITAIASLVTSNKKSIFAKKSFKNLFLDGRIQITIIALLLILHFSLIDVNGGYNPIFSLIIRYFLIWVFLFGLIFIKTPLKK